MYIGNRGLQETSISTPVEIVRTKVKAKPYGSWVLDSGANKGKPTRLCGPIRYGHFSFGSRFSVLGGEGNSPGKKVLTAQSMSVLGQEGGQAHKV